MTAAISQAVPSDGTAWRKSVSALTALFPAALTDLLTAASRVAIVPHEVLWRVPFDALPAGDGYLGDRQHIVVVGGSAAMLARAARTAPAANTATSRSVGVPQLTRRAHRTAASDRAGVVAAHGGRGREGTAGRLGASQTGPPR